MAPSSLFYYILDVSDGLDLQLAFLILTSIAFGLVPGIMYTVIERFILRGNTNIQGARLVHRYLFSTRHVTDQHLQHLGLPPSLCRGCQNIQDQPSLCSRTLQHPHLDYASYCKLVHRHFGPQYQLYRSSVRLRSRLLVGLWIHQVFGTA